MANEKRLQIMLSLLASNKSFRDLKKETILEKTALANHLNKLILIKLVYKPAYNTYAITSDGERFLRVLEENYQESEMKIIQDKAKRETREFSDGFIKTFFHVEEN